MADTSERTVHDDLWRTLQTVSDWIRVADTKAGAAFAVDGAVLALSASRLRSAPGPGLPATAALWLAVTLAATSVLFAIWTVVPRARRMLTDSITHYGTIAAFPSPSGYYSAALEGLGDSEELAKNLTRHIWTFSRAAKRKYVLVTWSISLLAGGMITGVVGLLLP